MILCRRLDNISSKGDFFMQPPIIRNELHKRIDTHFDRSFLAQLMKANYIPDKHLPERIDFKTLSGIMVV
jgi:hypothetical protein